MNEESDKMSEDTGKLYKKICKDVKKLNPEDCFAVYDYIQAVLKRYRTEETENSKEICKTDHRENG